MTSNAVIPPFILLDKLIKEWLLEDIGRGDRTTQGLISGSKEVKAKWIAKEAGVIAGLPIAKRVFQLLNKQVNFTATVSEGQYCDLSDSQKPIIATIEGPLDALLMGERVAINLAMRLSGIATMTRKYVDEIVDLPTQFADTRKTTPGMRLLEKYATQVGGGVNQRMGLDDSVLIKDNHIAVAGGIGEAVTQIRSRIPYPLTIEVETETLDQVQEALKYEVDTIMLDNMPVEVMKQAVGIIRGQNQRIKIEASGNVNLKTIRATAETGVDYISSSGPITRSTWLDLSQLIIDN